MDYNKIGNLIASERKAKKLTQAKLAEKLFVSEKTISKWENGNGIPDTNVLQKLCEIFDISVNELLNGERMPEKDYVRRAEDKLIELQKEKEQSDKRLLHSEIVLAVCSLVSFLVIMFVSVYMMDFLNYVTLPIILIILDFVVFLGAMSFGLSIEQKAGFYVCKKCTHKYVPTYLNVFFAPHFGRTRFMKCPHCHKFSWHKKVVK